jgi:hypothetical protein
MDRGCLFQGDLGDVNLLAEWSGLLREHVSQAEVRATILRKLKSFFINFQTPDSRERKYLHRIDDMVAGKLLADLGAEAV